MANKPLTIDVNTAAIPNGSLDKWSQLANTSIFIKNIITPQLGRNTDVGQLVSGIPTAFARVDLFKNALDHVATSGTSNEVNNLVGYYERLADEWKGLIACLALDYQHISVRKIELSYSDGKDVAHTANIYEPKGAFGNMLLRRANRWKDQNVLANQAASPFINVIKYRGDSVVGATAPESLLFTSTGYRIEHSPELPWIDSKTGKFTDPLNSVLNPIQIATLHAYVAHLLQGLGKIEDYYKHLPVGEGVNYTSIRSILSDWLGKIAQRAQDEGFELSIGSTPPVNAGFSGPFGELFCHQDILYGLEGVISDSEISGSVEFDPKNTLLEDTAHIARLDLNITPEELKRLPILVLTADVKGMREKAYFALPLSAKGLNVFGKNVAALVGMAQTPDVINSTLKATYDPYVKSGNLEVVLTMNTLSGKRRELRKVYTADGSIKNKDILIWPNFVSPQWDAYFMYSELPHNGTSQAYKAFPFVGEMEGDYFRITVDKNNEDSPVLLSRDGKIVAPEAVVKSDLLVLSNESVADNKYKYEIYRSNKPFKGVRLLSPTGNEGGYLLINYSSDKSSPLPHDLMSPGAHSSLQPVRLGIDFGSTNTSIAYSSDSTQEKGFVFPNQRVSLFGYELPGKPIFPRENQVFFFQGAGTHTESNAIKSVLTLHDHRRLKALGPGESVKMRNEKEVVGGFPSFADNLPFSNSDKNKITLFYPNGVGEVTQIHNMKWENTDDDKAHKSAFLRTLMLQVYATLFEEGLVPESIKWSYPSAMSGQLLLSYQTIWDNLKNLSPVLKENGERYNLDISRYTDTTTLGEGGFGNEGMSFGQSSFGFGFGNNFNDDSGFGGFNTGEDSGFSAGFGESKSSDLSGSFSEGFGSEFSSGFGSAKAPQAQESVKEDDFMPDDPNKEISYDPEPLYPDPQSNPSLSEAEAVANFITSRYANERDVLNLCFDVGGSTTDISALFFLKDNITMIKQNSLRFAAQRVSQAVGHFPEFRQVLTAICAQYKIQMVGLNFGNDTYSASTAPYFFDQIVNRLNDNQLETLYQRIAADCPKLMCVNMYVTGLLMFYAGELAHKLIDDLKRTPDNEWGPKVKPNVRVTFAGKGSRLFQWLNAVNPQAARQYYGEMFIKGFGRKHLMENLAGWQRIILPQLHDPAANIKYEVSKGLAKGDTSLQRPKKPQKSEIIGELGFEVIGNDNKRRSLEFTNSVSPAMIESFGNRFLSGTSDNKAAKFTEFCGFFYEASHKLFGWNVNPNILASACRSMNITAYVQNMPEYRAAQTEARQSGTPFSYVAPIIILEGMKFYDDTLLKLL